MTSNWLNMKIHFHWIDYTRIELQLVAYLFLLLTLPDRGIANNSIRSLLRVQTVHFTLETNLNWSLQVPWNNFTWNFNKTAFQRESFKLRTVRLMECQWIQFISGGSPKSGFCSWKQKAKRESEITSPSVKAFKLKGRWSNRSIKWFTSIFLLFHIQRVMINSRKVKKNLKRCVHYDGHH